MKFRDFQHFGRKLHIFNLNDIRKIAQNFHRQQLGYWLNSGYVKPFAKMWIEYVIRSEVSLLAESMVNKVEVSLNPADGNDTTEDDPDFMQHQSFLEKDYVNSPRRKGDGCRS